MDEGFQEGPASSPTEGVLLPPLLLFFTCLRLQTGNPHGDQHSHSLPYLLSADLH